MGISAYDRVRMLVTGTGTGNLTCGAAVLGYRTVASLPDPTTMFSYEIHALDNSGNPSGSWETGLGRCSGGASVFERLQVYDSSNSGSLVSFSAGNKQMSISATAAHSLTKLAKDAILYVRDTANGDNGSGLVDNDTEAFLTIAAAIGHAKSCYALGANYVRIQLTGDYSAEVIVIDYPGFNVSNLSIWGKLVEGVITLPVGGVEVSKGSGVWLNRLNIPYLTADNGALVETGTIDFIAGSAKSHVTATRGSRVILGSYNVSGSPATGFGHLEADSNSVIDASVYMYLKANVTCDKGWAYSKRGLGHFNFDGLTISLGAFSVTGKRYELNGNAVCWTNGGGASFLPGDSAGTTATGGQYL